METFSYNELTEEYFKNKNKEDVLNHIERKLNINAISSETQLEIKNKVSDFVKFRMSATVHKVLYHGEEVIKHHLLPIGDLSEEAQEKRKKDYRFYREHNTRKISRISTNEDLFPILLATSDPFISSIRSQWKLNHSELNAEAKALLQDTGNTSQMNNNYNLNLVFE